MTKTKVKVKQLQREIRVTDSIQRRIEKANARDLKSFKLRLEMDEEDSA